MIRPYANLVVFNKPYLALLDSGANKRVVGGALAKNIVSGKYKYNKTHGHVWTADGTKQPTFGTITIKIKYNNIEAEIEFLIVPWSHSMLFVE